MTLPDCCKDDMADRVKGGSAKGKALVMAMAAHRKGDHDDQGKEDGDGDGDEDGDADEDK